MPGIKIGLADYLSRHPVGEATRVSLYENTFSVVKLQSITNSLGYKAQKTTGGAISKSKKLVGSANAHRIGSSNRKILPDEGGKTRDHRLTNQNAVPRIIECNDRKGAKIVELMTECQLREFAFNPFQNNKIPFQYNNISTMTNINLKKQNKILLRYPEITSGSSSELEVVDARQEAVTTGTRDVKCNTVMSILSAFGGTPPGGIPCNRVHVRNSTGLQYCPKKCLARTI